MKKISFSTSLLGKILCFYFQIDCNLDVGLMCFRSDESVYGSRH